MIEDDEAARERREERDRLAAESFQWDQGKKTTLMNFCK